MKHRYEIYLPGGLAAAQGVAQLYLQTDHPHGGLYAKLSWDAVESVMVSGHTCLVMRRDLDTHDGVISTS